MRLSKEHLDFFSTLCGLIVGVSGVLVANGVVNPKIGGTVGGIAGVCLGYLTNKPASAHPTTQELERQTLKD